MVGLSNDGTGLSLGGSLSLGKNGLTLNTDGTTLYGQGLTLLGAVPPAVALWATEVVANGGSVSTARLAIASTFVVAEEASGAWNLTDDYMPLWGENAPQALTSLKQRRLATAVNSPTFTADRGYVFNGSTSYLNTGFIPATHAVAMTATSVHFEVYERTNVNSGTAYAGGVLNSSSRGISIRPRSSNNSLILANSAAATFTLPSATSVGLTQGGRNGLLVTDAYGAKNGVDMTRTVNPASLGASLPVNSIFLGAYDNAGTAAGFRAASIGFSSVGAALSQAQRLARYNAVQAWATAVGAQV